MLDRVGQRFGSYRLVQLLGRGNFADVSLGEHVHLGTQVAIKVLHGPLESRDREGFLAEARTLARLRHPHIVRVLDFGIAQTTPFLVLDYAPGGSLRTLHPKGTRLPLATVVSYVTQVAEALQYAHDERVIHRDLKPENLLVGHHHEVLLSDFGLAIMTQSSRHQQLQETAGTAAYMAPEVLRGQPCTASDQYALGIVVYEWLSGERPFAGTLTEVAVKHALVPPPALCERVPSLPAAVEQVVFKALAKDPEHRFAQVRDFALALEAASASEGSGRTVVMPSLQQPVEPRQTSMDTLPTPLTPLIGREQEVAAVCALLAHPDVRLLTLLGTGGIGKTHLSMEVAREARTHFADGVCFVSLAPISDPDLVVSTIAQVFGLTETGNQPLFDLLKRSLRDKHLLLLLDNFEQVVAAAPRLSELLATCPHLKILVTSRVVLHVRGEHEFSVPALALPDLTRLPEHEILSQYAAVALFLQRAQALKPDFQMTSTNARAIAEICVHLDGLPLAIELAAARSKLLPPQVLLTRLAHRLQLLTSSARDVPARQQTLRNTIVWSYQLLEAEEQRLFCQFSVFVGGCTLEAVEALYAALNGSDGAGQVLDRVASLVDKSLLQQVEQRGEEEPRLVMLETIREFGLEALAASEEAEATRQAHAAYYLTLAEQAEPELRGTQQALCFNRLEAERDNFRGALGWAVANGEVEIGLRLVGALWWFWMLRGHYTEGLGWLERVQERSRDAAPALQAKAFTGAGSMAWAQGNYQQAMRWHRQALALYREVGDKQGIAFALNNLGNQAQYQGAYERARALLEESLALYQELGDQWGIAIVLGSLGLGQALQGDYERARALFEEDLALSRELQDKSEIAMALHNLGDVARYQGDHQRAMAYLEECLSVCEELGNKHQLTAMTLNILGLLARWQGNFARAVALHTESLALSRELGEKLCIAQSLEGLASVVVAQGELAWAVRLWGAAEALREAISAPLPPIDRAAYERAVAAARVSLGEKAFAADWAEGHTMTAEQAFAAKGPAVMPTSAPIPPATASAPLAKSPVTYPAGLTEREVEVLRLVAQGLTDAQVAEQLVISPRTVNGHLRSIYSKIDVTSRSAATRYAVDHHLV